MHFRRLTLTILISAFSTAPAWPDKVPLSSGLYKISVSLELPNLPDMSANKTDKVCIKTDDNGVSGLVALSENNPLAKCPVKNNRLKGNELYFDIACPGGNAAVASAKFVLSQDRFVGAITMKMGGKNMTMTERQTGHRIGACKKYPVPPS